LWHTLGGLTFQFKKKLKFACVLPNRKTLALWPVEYFWDSQYSHFVSSATTTFIKAEFEV
jgi:hypothetical protein